MKLENDITQLNKNDAQLYEFFSSYGHTWKVIGLQFVRTMMQ